VPLGTHLFQLIFLVFTGYSCFFCYFTPCFTICHWILRLFSYLSGNISTFHWALMFPRVFYSECYKLYLDYFSYSSQNMTRFHWVLVFPQKFYMKFYKLWLGTHVSSCILLWMLQVVIWYWDYIGYLSRNMSGFHCVPMFPRLFYWYVASCHCMGLTFLSYFEWKISDFTGYSCFLCYFTRNVTNCSDYSDYSFIHHEILLLFTGWNTRLKKYKVFHNTCTDIINDSILHIISKLQD
jgi:hypothetical protein